MEKTLPQDAKVYVCIARNTARKFKPPRSQTQTQTKLGKQVIDEEYQ